MITTIENEIKKVEQRLWDVNLFLYDHPEISSQEVQACEKLVTILQEEGFDVEKNILDMETAFIARYDSGREGPTIAYLCEYDALPDIGHGCGHNLIATFGLGAGIVLKRMMQRLGGKVFVYGTPAEETSGGKVPMAEAGLFDEVDVAIMAHPANQTEKSGASLALMPIEFTFIGKSSHAAAQPEEGINALDAAIQTFNNINALRQHLKDDVRIHGIITEGGKAANIVPERAVAQFYVRALEQDYLDTVVKQVHKCAEAGALATGCQLSTRQYETAYRNMITNEKLSSIFTKNLKLFGVGIIKERSQSTGSLDMGDVSHRVPSIHPFIGITSMDDPIVAHTRKFADTTVSEQAREATSQTIGAMVKTALDLISSPELLDEVKEEFTQKI